MKTQSQILIPSVNFHLWEPCNFRCKFCFATFQDVRKTILPKGHLPKDDALRIVDALADAGFSKITFAGGEPTLCPWIGDLIVQAKIRGLTTMIVTNGSGLTGHFLKDVEGFLDWVVISVDSAIPLVNLANGRVMTNKIIPDHSYYQEKADLVHLFGMKLKINTVVTRKNYKDFTMSQFVSSLNPVRWKIFRALRVEGQNDAAFHEIQIGKEQFRFFLDVNGVHKIPYAVTENNDEMQGTYIMVDPAGRFFDNTKGKHTYSEPILEVGVERALNDINYDFERFVARGGLYEW